MFLGLRLSSIVVVWFTFATVLAGQVTIGTPPFGSFGGGPIDAVDLANLNAHITLPIFSKAGRGLPFDASFTYDTSIWYPLTSNGTKSWQPVGNWGVGGSGGPGGYVSNKLTVWLVCHGSDGSTAYRYDYSQWTYHDDTGTPHLFNGTSSKWIGYYNGSDACGSDVLPATQFTSPARDLTGYSLSSLGGGPSSTTTNPSAGAVLTTIDGTFLIIPINPTGQVSGGSFQDRNGNEITASSGVFTDTLGTTALTVSGTAPSPVTYSYTPPALEGTSNTVSVTASYRTYTVQTNFQCAGIDEYYNANVPLLDKLTYPDSSYYQFAYESTPGYPGGSVTGRLISITTPTGGTITYQYTGGNSGISCSDGSASGLVRTTPDGTWTYTRSCCTVLHPFNLTLDEPNDADPEVTQIDPEGNETDAWFSTDGAGFQSIYEIQRQVYQGPASPSNLLRTTFTCYPYQNSICSNYADSVTNRTVFTTLPGGLTDEHNYLYSGYGAPTEIDDYDYGQGAPGQLLRKTLITYAALGSYLNAFRQTVTVENGFGNTIAATTYSYDQYGLTGTSGTPQHISASGPYGNLTSIAYPVSGLSKTFKYYDTGNIYEEVDVNGAIATYTFGACGNSFLTSVSLPLSLLRSYTWDCTGGVQTQAKDENSHSAQVTYADADFWRPNGMIDQSSNVTNLTYGLASVESSMPFNSQSSASDTLVTVDSLGRARLSQVREAPGSNTFDSVETDYDVVGRPFRTTLAYAGTAGQTNPNGPAITTLFDALGRPVSISDANGGVTTYSYNQNDVLVSGSPAPSNENPKARQYQYDSLGRLTSVCEITAGTEGAPSGLCAQSVPQVGYWTVYTYDALGDLTAVTQNAQSSQPQQRSYFYDAMGRLIAEINPENSAAYAFDSDATCGTSKGDLVKKLDQVGNITCYGHDVLHRMTSTTYTGPYAANTPNRYFVYDAATVNSIPMVNTKSRLAEAYTAACSTCSKITDIGFSYTPRGGVSDSYESTPHSSGYYHVNEGYWANGVPSQLSGVPSLPTVSYGVDPEGRSYSVSASSGQSPLVSSTSYNAASAPTTLVFGSSDSDSYSYDPNTNRMKQYQFNVHGQSVIGVLHWNPVGTLGSLQITDPFNNLDDQTCTYSHDDLTRLIAVNCHQ